MGQENHDSGTYLVRGLREALTNITAEARHHLHTGASSLDRRIAQAEAVLSATPALEPVTDDIAALTAERDYYHDAYERKLAEHAAISSLSVVVCKERDALQTQVAALRAALELALLDYEGYLTRADGAWECASCGAFAGTGAKPERLGKAHREGCGGADWIEAALAATPEQSLAALEDAACLRMAVQFAEGKRTGELPSLLLSGHVQQQRREAAAEALETAAKMIRHEVRPGSWPDDFPAGMEFAQELVEAEAQRLREAAR